MASKYFTKPTRRIIQTFTLIIFIVMTPQLLADECHDFSSQGWRVNSICASHFENGIYAGSYCIPNSYIDPWAEHQTMCLPGTDQGTCTGSNCDQDSLCTNDGYCSNDFDCCGLSVCDLDRHRCHEGEENEW
jgi:hypothetical protein